MWGGKEREKVKEIPLDAYSSVGFLKERKKWTGRRRKEEEEEEVEELEREAGAQLQGPASPVFARIFLLPFQ